MLQSAANWRNSYLLNRPIEVIRDALPELDDILECNDILGQQLAALKAVGKQLALSFGTERRRIRIFVIHMQRIFGA